MVKRIATVLLLLSISGCAPLIIGGIAGWIIAKNHPGWCYQIINGQKYWARC